MTALQSLLPESSGDDSSVQPTMSVTTSEQYPVANKDIQLFTSVPCLLPTETIQSTANYNEHSMSKITDSRSSDMTVSVPLKSAFASNSIDPAAPSTSYQLPVATKRTGFFTSSTTSTKRSKRSTVTATHQQFGAMAEMKTAQMTEQTAMLRMKDDRDKQLHALQVEKLQLEIALLREREQQETAAHTLGMQLKYAQLRLLQKQLGEE
jgi:hypothetical protein